MGGGIDFIEMWEQMGLGVKVLMGERVLSAYVLATTALEQQVDTKMAMLPLLKMDRGRPSAGIVSAIHPRNGVDRVRAQVGTTCCLGRGQSHGLAKQ